jgi:hypothetical protein
MMSNNEPNVLCWPAAEIEVPKRFWIAKLGQDGPDNLNMDGPFHRCVGTSGVQTCLT